MFLAIFKNFRTSLKILMNSTKFREIPIKKHQNQHENDQLIFISTKIGKIPKFCEKNKKSKTLEYGAVRRNVNLVDLEKPCKMSIWLLS